MAKVSPSAEAQVWAEFVMFVGTRMRPEIIGRRDVEWAFDMIADLLEREGSVEAAKEAFLDSLRDWLRRAS